MPSPECPKCNSHKFELKLWDDNELNKNFVFIQCSYCGYVVGVSDHEQINYKANVIKSELS